MMSMDEITRIVAEVQDGVWAVESLKWHRPKPSPSQVDEGPPNKPFQVSALKRIFNRLNPDSTSDVIDWSAEVDPKLRLDENLEDFAKRYPMYEWRVD